MVSGFGTKAPALAPDVRGGVGDPGQRGSLQIGQPDSGWRMRAKDPVLCNEVFILQSRSCWFTVPVTYANSCASCVFFIETHHHISLMFSTHSDHLTIRKQESLELLLTSVLISERRSSAIYWGLPSRPPERFS